MQTLPRGHVVVALNNAERTEDVERLFSWDRAAFDGGEEEGRAAELDLCVVKGTEGHVGRADGR